MRKVYILLCLAIFFVSILGAQEISEKKEVAVFHLSFYDWRMPPGALGFVDEHIKDVFINLGRFRVIGMDYRLSSSDISEFIDHIRSFKEDNIEIPEAVRLGEETFTEADFNKLINSFILVVPVLTFYEMETSRSENGDLWYKVELETAFTFISAEKIETIGHFFIRTTGLADNAKEAVRDAVEDIPQQLSFELRRLPEFQLKTGILEVRPNEIIIQFGSNMGVVKGDEFVILTTRVLPSGITMTDETGLLVVKSVHDEISFAQLIYSDKPPMMGDQLREIPRVGTESAPYLKYLFLTTRDFFKDITFAEPVLFAGVRQTITRGFSQFRPVIGIEVPIVIAGYLNRPPGFPVNMYLGMEVNWQLKRFQVLPIVAVGVGGSIGLSEEEQFAFSHAGGFGQLTLSYLFSRDARAFLDIGIVQWIGLNGADTYGGVMAGLGVAVKY